MHVAAFGHTVQIREKYPRSTSHRNLLGIIEKLFWENIIPVNLIIELMGCR